jgi:propanediol dehydratase large subunit
MAGWTSWTRAVSMRVARQRRTDGMATPHSVALVNAAALRLRGVKNRLIAEYVMAVEAAWTDAAPSLVAVGSIVGTRPSIHLHPGAPRVDPQTVTATVGTGGKFGGVEAATPGTLRIALAQYLAERFGRE